ncbi:MULTISPECIES: hypothetical protein [unclassified Endozoicomonas]|uniref:hypothetical protein n=2 Tax=Endozoicomonas TaxID=305899 RepID=UPI003BB4FE2F
MNISRQLTFIVILGLTIASTGCTSVARKVGELQIAVYETYYNAFDQMARNGAEESCQKQQEESSGQMDSLAYEQCLASEYQQQMDFYVSTMNRGIQNSSARRATQSSYGTKVYRADECIGSIVNGVCHGSILPKTANHPTCYGQMINGQCTGPMF